MGQAAALITRLEAADVIYRRAAEDLLSPWRTEPFPPERWSKLLKGWQHLPRRHRLPSGVVRNREKLTLTEIRWKHIEGKDEDGNEVGIATCGHWIEITPCTPLVDKGPRQSGSTIATISRVCCA